MSFVTGKDFNSGDRVHAVPAAADEVGSSRPTRHGGYRVPYKALCGLTVWRPYDRDTYEDLPWDAAVAFACRTCVRLAQRRAEVDTGM